MHSLLSNLLTPAVAEFQTAETARRIYKRERKNSRNTQTKFVGKAVLAVIHSSSELSRKRMYEPQKRNSR